MENQRLKELAGLITEKKWSGDVKAKTHPKEGTFTGSAASIVKELMAVHKGDAGAASKALNFYINRAGAKLENKEELNKAKATLAKKVKKEEYNATLVLAGVRSLFEKKDDADDMDMDMDSGDDKPAKGEGKKSDEDEETLPKIVTRIAKKAVGKDEEELEDLIMKVYNAGHKDGESEKSEKKDVKEAALTEKHHVKKGGKVTKKGTKAECEKHAEENGGKVMMGDPDQMDEAAIIALNEKHHVKKGGKVVKKGLSKKEADDYVEDNGGTVHKGEPDKMDEDVTLTEKHHVKKGGKITKRGSKKECEDHAEENGGKVMPGEGGIEESEDLEDLDFGSITEDWTEIQHAMAKVRTDRLRKPVMTPKGSGTIEVETATLMKGQTDPKAGPYDHQVTVKLNGSANKATFPAQQVKFFKGSKPDAKMLPPDNSSKAMANADKSVGAKATQANQPGKMPSHKSMWKA